MAGYDAFDEDYRPHFRRPRAASVRPGAAADLLMAWRRTHGSGRVFYTALGHREEVWQDARFQQHLLGALRWALMP